MSVSGFMGFLKGKSSVKIYSKFANLKFMYRNREFWRHGYYVDTIGKNTKIQEYIANQLKEDKRMEQMTIFEVNDPFKKEIGSLRMTAASSTAIRLAERSERHVVFRVATKNGTLN